MRSYNRDFANEVATIFPNIKITPNKTLKKLALGIQNLSQEEIKNLLGLEPYPKREKNLGVEYRRINSPKNSYQQPQRRMA